MYVESTEATHVPRCPRRAPAPRATRSAAACCRHRITCVVPSVVHVHRLSTGGPRTSGVWVLWGPSGNKSMAEGLRPRLGRPTATAGHGGPDYAGLAPRRSARLGASMVADYGDVPPAAGRVQPRPFMDDRRNANTSRSSMARPRRQSNCDSENSPERQRTLLVDRAPRARPAGRMATSTRQRSTQRAQMAA